MQLAYQLKGTAIDLGSPGTRFGFGRLDTFPAAPRGMVILDCSSYQTGDELRLSTILQPGSAFNVGDAYTFAILPDGSAILSLIPTMAGGFIGTPGL